MLLHGSFESSDSFLIFLCFAPLAYTALPAIQFKLMNCGVTWCSYQMNLTKKGLDKLIVTELQFL